jgi:hypothetical protein
VSTLYGKPSWQSTSILGVPNDQQRDVPDISLESATHTPYLVCISGFAPCEFTTSDNQLVLASAAAVSGTSASSPSFAGIMALVDQKQGGRQGLANYVLYKLAGNETFANCNSSDQTDPSTPPPAACVFNDITEGNNGVPGNDVLSGNVPPGDEDGQLGYNALLGYDSATGLGSVDATNLVNSWSAANFQGSLTGLTANGSTSVQHGQAVSFSVTVNALAAGSAVPTGLVSLIAENGQGPFSRGTAIASGSLVGGAFSVSTNTLPGGTYNVVASYPGDGTFAASNSDPVQVIVSAENSTLTLNAYDVNRNLLSSPISEPYGVFAVVHASVAAASGNGSPTGVITFSDGGVAIAAVPLNSAGEAELFNCTTPSFCLTIGAHNITASYSGNSGLNSVASSGTLIFNISKGVPALSQIVVGFRQSGDPPGSVTGDQFGVSFQNIGTIPPTGTITFVDSVNNSNNNLVPPITLDASGHIPVQTFVLQTGTNTVTAQYSGDNNYSAVANPAVLTIAANGKLVAQITITPLASSITVGQSASFNIKVVGGASQPVPTGQVLLFDSSQSLLTGALQLSNLTSGSVTAQFTMPSAVSNILVEYEGDSNYASILSNSLAISVSKATPVVSVSSSLPGSDPNRQVTLVASITPPAGAFIPDGTVQLFDSFNGGQSAPIGPLQVLQPSLGTATEGPTATAALPVFLPLGTHVFTATYSGNHNYNLVFVSNSATVNVVSSLAGSKVDVSESASSSLFGGSLTFTATVTPTVGTSGVPTGNVTFFDGTMTLSAPVSLSNGVATLTTSSLGAGAHSITAQYGGDGNFFASSSLSLIENVLPVFQFATPSGGNSVTVTAGQTAAYNFSLNADGYSGSVALTCTGAPQGAACLLVPNTATLAGDNTVPLVLTVATPPVAAAAVTSAPLGMLPVVCVVVVGCLFFDLSGKPKQNVLVGLAFILTLGAVACGGGSGAPTPPPPLSPQAYTLVVTGAGDSASNSISLTLIVNP